MYVSLVSDQILSQFEQPEYRGAIALPGCFSADECNRLMQLRDSLAITAGGVGADSGHHTSVRNSNVGWISPSQESAWFYQRFLTVLAHLNSRYFGFDLLGFDGPLQFTEYGPGQFYDWHQDIGPGRYQHRKLTGIVVLSSPKEYHGGGLEFIDSCLFADPSELSQLKEPTQGTVIAFPTYQMHRVRPIESGVRRVIVGWLVGPGFR